MIALPHHLSRTGRVARWGGLARHQAHTEDHEVRPEFLGVGCCFVAESDPTPGRSDGHIAAGGLIRRVILLRLRLMAFRTPALISERGQPVGIFCWIQSFQRFNAGRCPDCGCRDRDEPHCFVMPRLSWPTRGRHRSPNGRPKRLNGFSFSVLGTISWLSGHH